MINSNIGNGHTKIYRKFNALYFFLLIYIIIKKKKSKEIYIINGLQLPENNISLREEENSLLKGEGDYMIN